MKSLPVSHTIPANDSISAETNAKKAGTVENKMELMMSLLIFLDPNEGI